MKLHIVLFLIILVIVRGLLDSLPFLYAPPYSYVGLKASEDTKAEKRMFFHEASIKGLLNKHKRYITVIKKIVCISDKFANRLLFTVELHCKRTAGQCK